MGIINMSKNIKEIHPNKVVLYKVGTFYNAYGKDAYIVSYIYTTFPIRSTSPRCATLAVARWVVAIVWTPVAGVGAVDCRIYYVAYLRFPVITYLFLIL